MSLHWSLPVEYECVASGVTVDPVPPVTQGSAVCPACGRLVPLGGTPFRPTYSTHNTTDGGSAA